VIAAAKGLIVGAVSFCRRDGSTVNASSDREGLLMPNLKDILSVNISLAKWILVIEKEATFRCIAASTFWTTLSSSGIMITAKGYPDISTRAMLRFLSSPSPQNGFRAPPVYAMVDLQVWFGQLGSRDVSSMPATNSMVGSPQ
jgi:meiotic recombination protein SPO11